MLNVIQDPDEYEEKLKATSLACVKQLEKRGVHATLLTGDIGVSISLTQFGLDGVYAEIDKEEIEYIVDNEIEI